jgi:hypothetical protein
MAFAITTRSAVDGAGTTIPGGVVFIDESGVATGPWIICKSLIDPAGANVQFVLSNNAAKCDVSSINGTAVGTPAAYGSTPTGNALSVNAFVTNTVAVSGTVTANQGAPPWTIQGDSASGASNAGNPVKVGGAFNTTQPTVTTGQTVDAQFSARGAMLVATGVDTFTVAVSGTVTVAGTVTANQGGAPWSQNLTQWNSVALGSPSNYGTSPGAVSVPGVNAFVTNTVTVSGTVTANQGGAPWTVNPGTPSNWGIGATAATVPANAVLVAGDAMTTLPTATTAGQQTGMAVDKFGRPVVIASSTRDNMAGSGVTTITTTTETTIIAAGAAGIFNDIHMILVSNTSASDVRVDIRDSTAGTIQFTFWAKANTNTIGFSSTIPWPQTTAANNWTAQLSGAVTDVRISALYVKNK